MTWKNLFINVAFLRYIIELAFFLFKAKQKDKTHVKGNILKTLINTTYETILIGSFIFYYSFLIDKTYQGGIEIISQKFSSQTAFFIISFASWFGYEATRWYFRRKYILKEKFSSSKRLFFNMFLNTFVYGSGAILGVVLVVFLFWGLINK